MKLSIETKRSIVREHNYWTMPSKKNTATDSRKKEKEE